MKSSRQPFKITTQSTQTPPQRIQTIYKKIREQSFYLVDKFLVASRQVLKKPLSLSPIFDEATPNLARKSVKERKCLGTKNKLKQKVRTTLKREGN